MEVVTMSTEIDPRIVREVAEAAFRSDVPGSAADRVEAALIASGMAGPVLSEKFDAYTKAVGAEYDRLVTRKVARTAMEMAATRRDDLDSAIRHHGGLGDMPEDPEAKAEYRKAYGALYSAAAADMKAGATVVVSWPDEQSANSPAALVAEFHAAFDLPRADRPVLILDTKISGARQRLLEEEVAEVAAAKAWDNLPGIAQELADVVYVAYGTALTYGIDLDAVLAEVHRANMAKLGPDGRPTVVDGKVVKPEGWQKPDVAGVLAALNVRGANEEGA